MGRYKVISDEILVFDTVRFTYEGKDFLKLNGEGNVSMI
jgi:hypothetical protein